MGVAVCKASMLNWLGGPSAFYIYALCLDLSGCSGMQGICAQLTREDTWSVMVFKASMLNWLRGILPAVYMHCPWSSSGCSGIQGICTQLTGEGHMKCNGIQGIYAQLTGGSICLLYICIVLDLTVGVTVCKASSLIDWGAICLLYICIVLDLAVGVAVCKASVLDWLGASALLSSNICIVLWSSSGCTSMQGIYAQIDWGDHLPSIYMHHPRSSSGCSMQGIYAQLTGVDHLPSIYMHLCLDLAVGVAVCKASVLNWLGGPMLDCIVLC